VVFMVLLLVLLPVMSMVMVGDGTLKGKLQTFISYGLSLTNLLLCLLTIIISSYALSNDLKDKHLFTVLTKPLRRYELLCGKLLGIILLDLMLLLVFGSVIYGLTISIPKISNASEEELAKVNKEFFTARASLLAQDKEVSEEQVEAAYAEMEKRNGLPEGKTKEQVLRMLRGQKKYSNQSVGVSQNLIWEFENVKPLAGEKEIFVRFKYDVSVNPPDYMVFGRWIAGDYRQIKYGIKPKSPIYVYDSKDVVRTVHEFSVPVEAIAEDGYFALVFENIPLNNTVVIFPPEDGMELLYKADSFTSNYLRAILVIFLRVVFLTVLGLSVSTWVSFPVAILICLVFYFTGMISGFVLESFDDLSKGWGYLYEYTLKPLIMFLPRFDKINASEYMISSRFISLPMVLKLAAVLVGVKSLILFLLGIVVFSRREIAKITV